MALVFTAQSLRNASRGVKSYSGVLIRAAASRNVPLHAASPMSGVQKRDFHFASLKAKYQNFVTRNSIYIAEINNTALKYGLFGVAVGNPSTWVVSLISLVNSMGMPWWGAIAGVALGFRVILLPFSVKASKQAMKMQEIQPQLNELMERARISQSMGLASDAGRVRDEMMDIYKRAGVSPMAPMLGSLIQLPVIMSCFMGIRKLCETVPAVQTGGALWFPNLAVPDPVFALPVLAGLTTLFMTELGADGMNANGQVGMKYMMRGMSLFTVFVAAKMSSGLCLYWIANATFAGVQTLCINPAARSTLKRWLTFSRKEDAVPPPPVAPVKPVKPAKGAKHVPSSPVTPADNRDSTSNANNKENVDSLLNDVKSSVFKK
ncbi:preprotein translocase, Oxa1 family [Blastocystis sp. ATCC 50177/Nand II]|uniref:Preprotein translocase, Oxa1 family n=1 Tax=Blastocystis sp. subtype 1 (strain ATCC 50177 / NandII) TaxID=478820 RepID=A0A196SJK4_BLAHN|nr:preprotein translocase, Oxa1 family [Blastocystis sp. ATCC 50177/Nand II]